MGNKTQKTPRRKTTQGPSRTRGLTRAQLRILRELVPDPVERSILADMVKGGELELPEKPIDPHAFRHFRPIVIPGKPVSQTIIEERR